MGDVVLIADPNLVRGKWHMGKVSEVYPSQDKLVRVVQMKTKDGYKTDSSIVPTRGCRRSTGSDDQQVTWDCWSGGSISAIIA